jgi:hypothetical protein
MKLIDILFEAVVDEGLKVTQDEFIQRLKDKFKNDLVVLPNGSKVPRYDFSNTVYRGAAKPFNFYCNKIGNDGKPHGIQQVAALNNMLRRNDGCKLCGAENTSSRFGHNQDKFIKKAEERWGKGRWDYSNLKYKGSEEPVDIICRKKDENGVEHGPFTINRAQWFLAKNNPMYCKQCSNEYRANAFTQKARTREEFIKRAEELHGKGTYDYSQMIYKQGKGKEPVMNIMCHKKDEDGIEHGLFGLKMAQGLITKERPLGCPKCAKLNKTERVSYKKDEWVDFARSIHKFKDGTPKYTYEKIDLIKSPYVKAVDHVIVNCPKKGHGDFSIKSAAHLYSKSGCPKCATSKGEDAMAQYLYSLGYDTIKDKKFDDCTNSWKGVKCYRYKFDAYCPELNTIFEFDGGFHFIKTFKQTDEHFKLRAMDDIYKNDYCKRKGIKMVRIAYTDMKDIKGQIDKALESDEMLWLSDNYPTDKGWRDKSIKF